MNYPPAVARALHKLGPRRDRRFFAFNCSAVVETLFESELFGHTRGAFTGAVEAKAGLFEMADGGTLFLDEIGELPLQVQAKLLRVIEYGEVQRVGASEGKRVDVRAIAATNRHLSEDVAAGRFRQDLYYRLNVVEIALAPLRERRDDIPYLTAAFIKEFAKRFEKPLVGLSPGAERLLHDAPWPGNIRELRNVLERACMLSEGSSVSAKCSPRLEAASVSRRLWQSLPRRMWQRRRSRSWTAGRSNRPCRKWAVIDRQPPNCLASADVRSIGGSTRSASADPSEIAAVVFEQGGP